MEAESRCDETSTVEEGKQSSIPPIHQIWEGLQLPFSAPSASISNSSDRSDEHFEGNSLSVPRRVESAPKTDAIPSDKTSLSTMRKEIVSNASIDPYSSTHDEVAKQLERTWQAPGDRTSGDSNKENPKDEVEEAQSSLVKQIPDPSGARTAFVQNEATCSEQLTKNDSQSVSCRIIVVTPKKSGLKKSDMSPKKALPPRSVSAEFEVHLPCRRDLLRRQRSLSFREYAEVAQIEPATSLAERPDDLWLQEEELETIKRRNSKLINKIKTLQQAGESTVKKRYCARGLERLINPNPTIMKRIQGRDAVLNEQDVQRSEGVFEEDIIACAFGLVLPEPARGGYSSQRRRAGSQKVFPTRR